VLEVSGQAALLEPWFSNRTKSLVKTPKLYFADTGLVSYLTGWRTAETASSGAMAGALMESYCVSEIIKSYRNRGLEPPVWYYRTKEKKEVDLLTPMRAGADDSELRDILTEAIWWKPWFS